MKSLLEFKEKLKLFYAKFDIYVISLVKFVLALVCSFLPVNAIVLFGTGLVLAHAYALSLEVFAVAAVLLLVMLLLYFRLAPEYGYLLAAAPLAFAFKIPYALPLTMGLIGKPVAAIPVACGTVVYYLLHYMKSNTMMLGESEATNVQQKLTSLVDGVINNKEMLLIIAAFALTLCLVYLIRRMSMDYAWQTAIVVGALADFLIILVGSMIMDIPIKLMPLFMGSLISIGIALVLEFFLFSVDYSRTEYVQFEDDEYYYYVKAVPKITIAVSDKKVKKINAQRKNPPGRRSNGHSKGNTRN